MSYEILVGLQVIDNEKYQQYRNAMQPILSTFGGRFGYDFQISKVLKFEESAEINRVFTINFPSEAHKDGFFNDSKYAIVKAKYFEVSVASTTIISSYEK